MARKSTTATAPAIGPWVTERDIVLSRRHYHNGSEAARVFAQRNGKFSWCAWSANAASHADQTGEADSLELAQNAADTALAT